MTDLRAEINAAMDQPGAKISKQKANYGGGMKKAHCAICKHFKAPDACEVVAGRINPQAWCKFYEYKKGER